MENRVMNILVSLVLILSIIGCDKINELNKPSAEEVLNNYLSASLKNQSKDAYKYISTEDKVVKSFGEYESENNKKDNPFAAVIVSSISYKVLKITESGSTAKADVETTLPDMNIMLKDIMKVAFSSAFNGKGKGEIEKLIAKKYETGEVPTTTKNEKFHLLKEKDGWKVFLNWEAKKIAKEKEEISFLLSNAAQLRESKNYLGAIEKYEEILVLNGEMAEVKEAIKETKMEILEAKQVKEKQEKISFLLSDAKQLMKSKKLAAAMQKYKEILALNDEMVEVKATIVEIKKEIQATKEKQEYLSKVSLYDLKAKYYETYREKKVPGVEFKIKNKGNRTLKEVQVTVYFKNSKGTIISEKQYHPVLVSKYSFSKNNKPLKPNYIWQQEQGKFYKADSVPTEWKEGAVSANITNVEFSE